MKRNTWVAVSSAPGFSVADVPAVVWPLVIAAQEGHDLKAAIADAVRGLGFDYFAFALRYRILPPGGAARSVWGCFPERFAEVYRERNYRAVDPRWPQLNDSATPCLWDRTMFPDTPALREFFDTAASFGIRSGVCMVINQPNPSCVEVFTVISTVEVIDDARRQSIIRSMGDLWAIGAYGHRLLAEILRAPLGSGRSPHSLTARELECLALAARGATSQAIADKLGISARTVNAHIEHAIRKCGAKNRHEAVARAISDGTIAL